MSWQRVATQHAIDRIQHAAVRNDQAYIEALVRIEAYVLKGGPQSWNEAVAWRELCRRYPADVRAIQSELAPPRPKESAKERALTRWGLKE